MRAISMYSMVFVLVFLVLPAFAQEDGLVAHWKFDGDASDSSGNAYDAEENGDVGYVDGKFGQALDLESDAAYLVVENNVETQLKSTDTYTIAVYVHPTDTTHGDIFYHGFGCSTWASWFLGMQGAEPDAALVPDSFVFGVRTVNGGGYTGISIEAAAGEWIHVAAKYDGTALTLYIDGEEVENLETGDIPYDSQEKLHIGGDPGCGGRAWYTGLLDDARLYNRALSGDEIKLLAKLGGMAVHSVGKLSITWGEMKKHN